MTGSTGGTRRSPRSPRSPRCRRARFLAPLALGGLLTLAGCGGGAESHRTALAAGVADLPAEPGPAAAPVEAWAAPGASPPAGAVAVATAPGVVHGVVTRGGQVVEGARVTLTAHDGVERLATTDAAGAYRFSDVPPGPYEVVVQAESGVTCEAGGCISAAWAERARDTVAAGATRRLDIDGD